MKQVRETAAGKSISAYVILNAKGDQVATVQAHFGGGGTCSVDCWTTGDKYPPLQQGRASGYGYDKFGAAIAGFVIDSHKLTNHCERTGAPKPPKGRKTYPSGYQAPKGYRLANYMDAERSGDGEAGYRDCYREAGLDYLKALGYRVIQAI